MLLRYRDVAFCRSRFMKVTLWPETERILGSFARLYNATANNTVVILINNNKLKIQ
jgi:hypothetical protein